MQTDLPAKLAGIADDMLSFFYPRTCAACGDNLLKNELLLCWKCFRQLPYTGYERWSGNPVMENLSSRIPLLQAWALLDFKTNGITQKLLHRLKYGRMPEIGRFLGRCAGLKAMDSGSFPKADYAIPIPLHPRKERKRGYNQSLCILEGFKEIFPIEPLPRLLRKEEQTQSQTRKGRGERWENVRGSFRLDPALASALESEKKPLHLLLVDDVITTGATIESCCLQLARIPQVKISVMAIASPL